MAGQAGEASRDDAAAAGPAAASDNGAGLEPAPGGDIEDESWAPTRRTRTCVASLTASRSLGPMVAGEAQARDFYAAGRRAFVADELAYNWSIQEGYFPDFEPIVDLLHGRCYLYKAADGLGGDEDARWSL